MQKQNRTLRVALAQLNLCVGDIHGNTQQVIDRLAQARAEQADVIVFPELTLSAYIPEDLLYRTDFLAQIEQALEQVKPHTQGLTAIIGLPLWRDGLLRNAACILREGACIAEYYKQALPNYRVFDEKRWFVAGDAPLVVDIKGVKTGVLICEDMWQSDPIPNTMAAGAEALLILNASPYWYGKQAARLQLLEQHAQQYACPIAYTNLVGGQDELVFDGDSRLVDSSGTTLLSAPLFAAGLWVGDMPIDTASNLPAPARDSRDCGSLEAQLYQAVVLGLRDYVHKNGFSGVILGLSGGIDSAMTLAVAVDALGADNVEAVMMPFHYTADMSIEDAAWQAEQMGVTFRQISIEPMYSSFESSLAPVFADYAPDVTEENMQARIRGLLLMAMSNKFGKLLLSTSNKSETAVGYATLYGDMAGAFAPLKDIYKTWVYRMAEYRNGLGYVIPQRVIERPPSAELAPDQQDQDSLPDYAELDDLLQRLMEHDQALTELVEAGFAPETVRQVVNLLLLNEYKRRQAPPGVRVTSRAFGKDWRYPMTSAWRKQLPLVQD